jgi:hypothetical protein
MHCLSVQVLEEVAKEGEVKFCRCWRSASFPFCDGSHDGHNLETGDNTGPVRCLKLTSVSLNTAETDVDSRKCGVWFVQVCLIPSQGKM